MHGELNEDQQVIIKYYVLREKSYPFPTFP